MTTAFAHASEQFFHEGMGEANNDRHRARRSSVAADKRPLYQYKKLTYLYSMNTPRTERMEWSRQLGGLKGN